LMAWEGWGLPLGVLPRETEQGECRGLRRLGWGWVG